MDKRYFSKKIVEWYLQNKRDLPWRSTKDPYKIWLSEIILQQTRVIQGLPYYNRFISTYPTVATLANAPQEQVLRLWQGLGYYTRARNLHRCAQQIVSNYESRFPNTFSDLKTLPGVGDYTAAAIASFSFKEKVAVVDGNVFRVLARVFGIDTPVNSAAGKKEFSALANELIDAKSPDLHNQAIMEFGATCCTPKNPSCSTCPLKRSCYSFDQDLQHSLPVKEQRIRTRERYFYYVVIRRKSKIHMKKRGNKDIWLGLYDFPLIERPKPASERLIVKEVSALLSVKNLGEYVLTDVYKHILSHQKIFCRFILVDSFEGHDSNREYYTQKQIAALPKPVLITRFFNDFTFLS
jgi:A/G-specific adenine glycosylase